MQSEERSRYGAVRKSRGSPAATHPLFDGCWARKDGIVCCDPTEQLCPQPLPCPRHRNFGTEPTQRGARVGTRHARQRASFPRVCTARSSGFTTASALGHAALRHPPGCSGAEFPAETLCRGMGRGPSVHGGSRRGRPGPSLTFLSLPFPFPPAAHPRPHSRTCGRCHRRRRRCGWCSTRSRRRPRRPPCPPPAPRVCRSPAGSAPRPRTASAQRRGRPEGRSPAEHRRSALPEPPAGRCPRRARARAAARSHCRCRSRWRPPITARPAAARGSAGRSACREGRRQQQVPGSWEAERGRERCALNAHRHGSARLGSAPLLPCYPPRDAVGMARHGSVRGGGRHGAAPSAGARCGPGTARPGRCTALPSAGRPAASPRCEGWVSVCFILDRAASIFVPGAGPGPCCAAGTDLPGGSRCRNTAPPGLRAAAARGKGVTERPRSAMPPRCRSSAPSPDALRVYASSHEQTLCFSRSILSSSSLSIWALLHSESFERKAIRAACAIHPCDAS